LLVLSRTDSFRFPIGLRYTNAWIPSSWPGWVHLTSEPFAPRGIIMASNEGRDQSVQAATPVSPTPGSPDLPTRIGDTGEYKAPPKMPRGPLQPGQTLGQYRILERLGAGGMGEVYKALHISMDRVVALKVLAPDLVQEQRARARFQREIKGAARLNHPNIVMAHDADEAEGHCFLVMEYV